MRPEVLLIPFLGGYVKTLQLSLVYGFSSVYVFNTIYGFVLFFVHLTHVSNSITPLTVSTSLSPLTGK